MSEAPAEQDALSGLVLGGRYQIEHKLGEGAMGAVYKAKHVKVGRPFAVKVLHSRLLMEIKVAQRFEREAELAGRLRHPNVVGVVDVGETPTGARYMVMDFAAGQDLAAYLTEAPFAPPRIMTLVRQMLEGLYHAHEAGLIHRDFKPENVIIEKDDHGNEVPRIVDFGIAILREGGTSTEGEGRLTTNGLVLGTPHYMAPEQAIADPIDHRIDLFALGIVIYEMLSGRLPFDGSGAEVARANLVLDPPPIAERAPGVDADPLLEAFARKLMAKRRDDRPATAKAAREILDLIDRDRPAAAAMLGVDLATTQRGPSTTAPSAAPRRHDPDSKDTFPPPLPPDPPPPVSAHVPAAVTTALTDPLAYDEAPRKQRPIGLIAAAGVLLVGGIIAIAVLAGGSDDAPAKPPEKVAITEPVPTPPAPPPTTEPTPTPPVDVAPTPAKPTKPKPDRGMKVKPKPTPAKPEVKVEPPPAKPEPVVVKKREPLTPKNLVQRYYAIGESVTKFGTEQQRVLYKRIQIQDAQSDPAKGAEAMKILVDLEAKLPAK